MLTSPSTRSQSLFGLLLLTFALTLAGILARPIESLSLFWPVNAVLAGCLLRAPQRSMPLQFLLVYLGMASADLLTGSAWGPALWFNLCNLGAVLAIWALLRNLPKPHQRLRTPYSVLRLFAACATGAAVAASLACLMAAPWFDASFATTWLAWFSEQFSTSVLVLPVLLTAPSLPFWLRVPARHIRPLPLLLVVVSLIGSVAVGGPGAIAFPVSALLWCALSYSPFLVSLLTLGTGSVLIVAVAQHVTHFSLPQSFAGVTSLVSARLGIAMLVLGPLVVACVSTANRALLKRLARQASTDHLTGALTRSALNARARSLLERPVPVTLMMLDIDHFKAINDQYGHSTGDQVLRCFARTVAAHLRPGEVFARMGGEEFVVLIPGLQPWNATFSAERIRRAVQNMEVSMAGSAPVSVTLSIGVSGRSRALGAGILDTLLLEADKALYSAKARGRNCVVIAEADRAAG